MEKSTNPFRWFDSSPDVIRLVVLMYVKYLRILRAVEDLLTELASISATKRSSCDETGSARCSPRRSVASASITCGQLPQKNSRLTDRTATPSRSATVCGFTGFALILQASTRNRRSPSESAAYLLPRQGCEVPPFPTARPGTGRRQRRLRKTAAYRR